jgi:antiviral helicase SKI2
VFSFSRRKCEEISQSLSKVDLSTKTEKSQIRVFYNSSISRLKGSDKELPQVKNILDLLERGIGIHHSGINFKT